MALEQFEIHQNAGKYNITMLAPGSSTVGAFGGFLQGGGFSTIVSSKLGLMADQVLSFEVCVHFRTISCRSRSTDVALFQVVTADGKFLHADPYENEDLFWAMRGGGPG
jgi:hypothetical protein